LPPSVFGISGSTNPTGDYAQTIQMIKARTAYLAKQANDTNYSASRVQQAVTDVTGGTVRQAGGITLPPERGMPQRQFEGVMAGLTDQDLAGVTSQNGKPITANFLRAYGRLEAVGPGQYLVNFAKQGADQPIYAHTGWDTAQPFPFVLDLKGRQPQPLPTPPAFAGAP
jgi:hypothetical protein